MCMRTLCASAHLVSGDVSVKKMSVCASGQRQLEDLSIWHVSCGCQYVDESLVCNN